MREVERKTEMNEDALIRAVQAGDLAGFEALIHRHGSHLRAFVAMRLPIAHLIEELAHETFVFAYRHIGEFEVGTDFRKWLRAIAFNLIRQETLKHQRVAKNNERYLEYCLVQSSARGVKMEDPAIAHLEECLESLPDAQRSLLGMKYRLSQTSREMADALGQSEAWVRTTLCRVRSALRDCVDAKVAAARPAN